VGRKKDKPTEVARLPRAELRKIRAIARARGLTFREAFRQLAGARIDAAYRRLKAAEHIETGEAGA
jgi:hypothetical protein